MPETVPITLPAMGESVSEGIVARWVKGVGDAVTEGETVVEVTTDKVDVEVPAPASGTIAEIVAPEGETVEIGATLATIAPVWAVPSAPSAAAPAPPEAPPLPEPKAAAYVGNASPLARRAAALSGVDLSTTGGSGAGGIVRKADVLQAPAVAQEAHQAPAASDGEVAEPLRGPAASLVDYMERSREIPTATSFRTIAVDVLNARRRELNVALSAAGQAGKVSFTHLIGYAVARAAVEMPEMTAHFARDAGGNPVRVPGPPNLGLAVDTRRKDGARFLVVPVIRDAGKRAFKEFRDEYERLIERARSNALTADDLQGATLTLTNPGGIGTVASVPRLMPGQGTIIATGAIGYPAEWSAVSESRISELGVRKVMTMTSTYDHRIIQGAQSGEFLGRIEALLGGADSFYEQVFSSLSLPAPARDIARPIAQEPAPGPGAPAADRTMLAAMQAATSLVKAHRTHGHLGAHLDPLGTPPIGDPAMEPETYHLTPTLMESIPADLLRVYVPGRTLAEVLPNLRRTYCGTIAYEIEHIASHEQRVWLREHIESGAYTLPLNDEEKLVLLGRLTKVDAMERYLRRTFLGQKTFSIEGIDAMIPMLEALLTIIADDGISEVILGMAHRGRLATIAHVVNRPYESILNAFELAAQRRAVGVRDKDPTGDVKYHLGATGTYLTNTGKAIAVRLLPNPSHLEAVDGVVEGWTRATQTHRRAAQLDLDPAAALPLLIHGDAAFPAQGVVAEVLNLQALEGYSTGGTVHLIADNQVGFTTDPDEARSTRYASDLAKGFDSPIVHVNADDVEACMAAVRLAYDYRRTYHRDVVIDLVGYRRFGHNETDEPAYTQPLMYQKIREHPPVRGIFAKRLIDEDLITQADVDAMAAEAYARVAAAHKRVKETLAAEVDEPQPESSAAGDQLELSIPTAVPAETLVELDEELLSVPEGFTPNAKLARQMDRRRASMSDGGIDWGSAEALAIASLVVEGRPIRLTGQDTERGTFSQRHLVFHDERTGDRWTPMQHLADAAATFELHNSPLSEVGCLSFEYGYSAADPETTVIWEAQYGDFFNNAQMVIDQFISAARAKWGQRSRLVLLLPHGYEGSGPEHSSARIERFLQMSANGNMRVANTTTAAQYFHLLRNQALSPEPRPLVLFTPKSLLRLKEAASTLTDLSAGAFAPVLDDPHVVRHRDQVTTLLLCSGRIYYDLALNEARQRASDLAFARVELLEPLPVDSILGLVKSYPRLEEIVWVQEEPANMGAWEHVMQGIEPHLPPGMRRGYIGRPRRASPSEGYTGSHHLEQERIVNEALESSRALRDQTVAVATPAGSKAKSEAKT